MRDWMNRHIVMAGIELPFTPLEFLYRFLIPVLSFIVVALVLTLVVRRISGKYVDDEEKRGRIRKWSRKILQLLLVVGVALTVGSLLGVEAYGAFGKFFRVLNTPFFASGNTKISIITLLLIVPVVVLASWTGRLVHRGVETGTLKRFGLDAEQSFTVGRLIRYSVMALVFLFGLSMIGVDLSSIGVLFGVLGVGIGFGLQSLIANFFAGITLIGMGHIKEGDRIRVGEYEGIIRSIRLMNTELNTFENETVIVPNSNLTGGVIHNLSYKDRRVVIVNKVDVAYDSDLDRVTEILEALARNNPWLQPSSETFVRVVAFGESGITMALRTWIRDVGHRADAASWTNMEIWRAFKASGIEIPFPQRVVHGAKPQPDQHLVSQPGDSLETAPSSGED